MSKNTPKENYKTPHNEYERIIKVKLKDIIRTEQEYWKQKRTLIEQFNSVNRELSVDVPLIIPSNISSAIWGLRDGVAFVRYSPLLNTSKPKFDYHILNISLEEWGDKGIIVPHGDTEISLAQMGIIRGLGHITMIHCQINQYKFDYLEISYMKYGEKKSLTTIENVFLDFQLTFLGYLTQGGILNGKTTTWIVDNNKTIVELENAAGQFQTLLESSVQEEDLQRFIKTHPYVIKPSAEIIPKQKLGDDFITDFVLVEIFQQGRIYTLVEIEPAKSSIFNKDNSFTAITQHAIKQIHEWDIWIEDNKAFIQKKLSGFESPKYLVIIGRGNEHNETQKAFLRSHNRNSKISLLTYDDLLVNFKALIEKLKGIGDQPVC